MPDAAAPVAASHALWLRYVMCVNTGGTPEQRKSAFQRWRDLEQAEADMAEKAKNRKAAKALSG